MESLLFLFGVEDVGTGRKGSLYGLDLLPVITAPKIMCTRKQNEEHRKAGILTLWV